MANQLQVADLRELMEYRPHDGGLYWRARDAQTYMKYIPDIDFTEAQRLSRWFESRFTGKECGTTRNGNKEFIRISLGTRGTNIRRAKLDLIWTVATGEWPEGVVLLLDPDRHPVPDNVVCCSPSVAQIFADPTVGLYSNKNGGFFWRITMDRKTVLHQKHGYKTLKEARAARDAKLKELGLWAVETLEDRLHG